MRLIFLYVSHSRASSFIEILKTEGYWWLLKRLLETGIVDEVLVVMTCRQRKTFSYGKKFNGVLVRGLEEVEALFRPGDVVWCRGGWKAWAVYLERWAKKGMWLIIYAANTGRQRWTFWPVVFDDLGDTTYVDPRGRFQLAWKKPTNPELFNLKVVDRVYDVCIGASHIHDRKGQWKVIKVLIEHQKLFNRKLKCVLPGRFTHGTRTNMLLQDIKKNRLVVDLPGMVPRNHVAALMSKSKLFVRLGGGGQNDRGPLEALCCGCPILLETPKRHAPFISLRPDFIVQNPDNLQALAKQMEDVLRLDSPEVYPSVFQFHEEHSSVENVILPEMRKLFGVMREYPVANVEKLREVYCV